MKKTKTEKKTSKKATSESILEKRFQSGVISATIFSNEADTDYGMKKFFSVVLQRAYPVKKKGRKKDEWKYTSSFRKQDLASLNVVLLAVNSYLLLDEDDEEEKEDKEDKEEEDEEEDEDEEEEEEE